MSVDMLLIRLCYNTIFFTNFPSKVSSVWHLETIFQSDFCLIFLRPAVGFRLWQKQNGTKMCKACLWADDCRPLSHHPPPTWSEEGEGPLPSLLIQNTLQRLTRAWVVTGLCVCGKIWGLAKHRGCMCLFPCPCCSVHKIRPQRRFVEVQRISSGNILLVIASPAYLVQSWIQFTQEHTPDKTEAEKKSQPSGSGLCSCHAKSGAIIVQTEISSVWTDSVPLC